jgi:hypothetical protein
VLNILADKAFYNYCQLRRFELDFTGERLVCITQEEKARQMAAKSAAEHNKANAPNRQTYGQFKRQAGPDNYGKRPRN